MKLTSIRPLGAGAEGAVTLEYDHDLRRQVAVKCVSTTGSRRLLAEVSATVNLQHPSLAQVHRVTAVGDEQVQIVREYVAGDNLARVLGARDESGGGADCEPGREQTLSVPHWGRLWCHQLVDVLVCLHHAGITHGDIKADNVIVRPGRAVLIDFGLSQAGAGRRAKQADVSRLSDLVVSVLSSYLPMSEAKEVVHQPAWRRSARRLAAQVHGRVH